MQIIKGFVLPLSLVLGTSLLSGCDSMFDNSQQGTMPSHPQSTRHMGRMAVQPSSPMQSSADESATPKKMHRRGEASAVVDQNKMSEPLPSQPSSSTPAMSTGS